MKIILEDLSRDSIKLACRLRDEGHEVAVLTPYAPARKSKAEIKADRARRAAPADTRK